METKEFIQNYREAFGSKAPLPLLFGYSDKPIAETEKIGGCFFKGLQTAREGQPFSLSVDLSDAVAESSTRAFPTCLNECQALSR